MGLKSENNIYIFYIFTVLLTSCLHPVVNVQRLKKYVPVSYLVDGIHHKIAFDYKESSVYVSASPRK